VNDFIALMEPTEPETRRDGNRNRRPAICGGFSEPSPYPDEG
jgi:hypothetical protein